MWLLPLLVHNLMLYSLHASLRIMTLQICDIEWPLLLAPSKLWSPGRIEQRTHKFTDGQLMQQIRGPTIGSRHKSHVKGNPSAIIWLTCIAYHIIIISINATSDHGISCYLGRRKIFQFSNDFFVASVCNIRLGFRPSKPEYLTTV
jgi:hypothetical protein